MRERRAAVVLWGLPLLLFLLDQITKIYAEIFHLLAPPYPTMADHRSSSTLLFMVGHVSEDFFSFRVTHVPNAGLMLGVLEDAAPPIPWLAFMTATAIALLLSLWFFRSSNSRLFSQRLGALVVVSGVVGNLVDRLRLGYVIDWVHWQWRVGGWFFDAPAFNIADLAIVAGILLVLGSLAYKNRFLILAHTQLQGRAK